jgi:hypothetical protein
MKENSINSREADDEPEHHLNSEIKDIEEIVKRIQ